jgi:hypothetical protein
VAYARPMNLLFTMKGARRLPVLDPVREFPDSSGRRPLRPSYTEPGLTGVNVPLYDIFGSTIEVLNPNGTPITNYTYDPYGVVSTSPNNTRTPWPFLYHGMEQENLDSRKLYWEPGGNVSGSVPAFAE